MKIIIAGSRSFDNYKLLYHRCEDILIKKYGIDDITIISGTAKGADRLGELYANSHDYGLIKMPANWSEHGRTAGYIRNKQMAKIADFAIIFWDGLSRGTKHMIDTMKDIDKPFEVIRF